MKLILCKEDQNGLMFFGKRLSMDAALRQKILELSGERKLFVKEYTARQFESRERLFVCANFSAAEREDFCFAEEANPPLHAAEELYIFSWNRRYPADSFLDMKTVEDLFTPTHTEDFVGSSHPKITLNVYKRRGVEE